MLLEEEEESQKSLAGVAAAAGADDVVVLAAGGADGVVVAVDDDDDVDKAADAGIWARMLMTFGSLVRWEAVETWCTNQPPLPWAPGGGIYSQAVVGLLSAEAEDAVETAGADGEDDVDVGDDDADAAAIGTAWSQSEFSSSTRRHQRDWRCQFLRDCWPRSH